MENLKFPVGRLSYNPKYTKPEMLSKIAIIKQFPQDLKDLVAPMSENQLNTRYRPDGWTARQVVHHCADSHMNAYIRFRWALTEDNPKIKAYFEDRWAKMPDYQLPIGASIALLEGLHERWTSLIHNLEEEDLAKSVHHPEADRLISIKEFINMYAWHCKHHLGHIKIVINK